MSSRARNKLTVKEVAGFAGPGLLSDGGGLYLRVRPSGRSWFYIGTMSGRRIELGLGSDLDITLAKARERAEKIRGQLLDGIDPRIERAKARAKPVPVVTFGTFAKEWIAGIEDGFRNPKHRQQWRNTVDTHAAPLLNKPIDQISTSDVLAVLEPIWLSKPETASRLRGRIERILDAAKVKGLWSGDNPARWKGHLDKTLLRRDKSAVKHHAALPFSEITAFMTGLRKRPGGTARALEFAILTAARSGEVRGMCWSEVDLEAKLWTVPKERMKAKREHKVPLSDAALAVLRTVRPEAAKPEDIVFAAPRGGPLSDMALSQQLKRMGHSDITVHGFRSTFRDWVGEQTHFEREVVEMALAHALTSEVEAAYRRGTAVEKRRELMAAWAAFCGKQGLRDKFKSNRPGTS
ncbi:MULTISPECIES: site-specific integrase [unclassified Novosphingobium]|uniref:tyrosine-type recombinase/integrase n=1 Tax=unclassified Novosphingobium TaxID=2644732 RepID=UPI000ED7DB0B|nr:MULTISPECIES: site-specific integrase [unclassified Novosphingobium]HCF24851.1 integrase [Novosphingobium sp.]HQV04358.1 tyrosine-type recombinase/integrase [Novosphingobium sp.]